MDWMLQREKSEELVTHGSSVAISCWCDMTVPGDVEHSRVEFDNAIFLFLLLTVEESVVYGFSEAISSWCGITVPIVVDCSTQ